MSGSNSRVLKEDSVDIGKEADDLQTFSAGSLQEIDEHQRILARWYRERILVLLSTSVIGLVLVLCVLVMAFSDEQETRDWARQILSLLVGFAAGAIWPTTKNEASSD